MFRGFVKHSAYCSPRVSNSAVIPEPGLQADQRLLDHAWLRIGVGLAVAGQAMVFSLAVNLSPPEGAVYWILHSGLILSAVAVLVFLGRDLVCSALGALRQRRINVDLLFLLTLTGAFAGSLVATFTHTGAVYYEVVSILIVVHTAGKMLGARSRLSALRAVEHTREKFEFCWVRQEDGSRARRRVHAITAGDRVVVAPGEPVSVDGEIVAGLGYVQETSMTGEWRPVSRGSGDRLLAGTYSIDGTFEIRARTGPRQLDGVLEVVESGRLAPSRLQHQADQLVAWFLPVVVCASAATFVVWMTLASWDKALFNAMAVLLVSCPCAAGLATPVAIWGGLARLASFGLVARSGDFIDALSRCDVVCLDKTGTLSTTGLTVRSWQFAEAFGGRERWLQGAVAATEEGLRHPIAAALQTECHLIDEKTPLVKERRIEAGLGVVGMIDDESGRPVEIRIGEWALGDAGEGSHGARRCQRGAGSALASIIDERAAEGTTRGKEVFVFVDGVHASTIEMEETWRKGLDVALQELAMLGIKVEILTGDTAASALWFPGISVHAGLTPLEKHKHVRELVEAGRWVTYVGDGVNDAAAMSAAQASIAMQAGAELAQAAAMAVFAGDDLRYLPRAIQLARAARRKIRINLGFAAAYNAVGVTLAAGGVLHPVVAALLMVGSSAFVSVNALRSSPVGSTSGVAGRGTFV
jgi:heavy metal translocating P-type ATPase